MNPPVPPPSTNHPLPGAGASRSAPTELFDAAQARWPTRHVLVTDIIDLLQVTHARDRISDYTAAMRRGERFPPIAVFGVLGYWFLADGHKRLSAYRQLGPANILVECWPLSALLADLRRQAAKSWRRVLQALAALPTDRRPVTRLVAHTLEHWARLARSLLSFLARRRYGG